MALYKYVYYYYYCYPCRFSHTHQFRRQKFLCCWFSCGTHWCHMSNRTRTTDISGDHCLGCRPSRPRCIMTSCFYAPQKLTYLLTYWNRAWCLADVGPGAVAVGSLQLRWRPWTHVRRWRLRPCVSGGQGPVPDAATERGEDGTTAELRDQRQ